MLLLNNYYFNVGTRRVCSVTGFDYKKFVVGIMRGFPPQKDFLAKFRFRPSAPLLSFLNHRLNNFDERENEALNRPLFEA